jgi:very-short-patch-repair endonuclease
VTARAVDDAIARLSRKQHGAWSRRQAIARGATPKMIRTRLSNRTWLQLDDGVYGHAAAPATWERSVVAAVLAEPWAVASHRCAAVVHSIIGFRPGRPELTVRPGANARGRLGIVHRGVDVRTTMRRGIPVVTVDQVFVDLAQVVSERRLAAALAGTADREPTVLDGVRDRYCALAPKGGRDLRPLRSVLLRFGAGSAPQPSDLELRLVHALHGARLSTVEVEAPFPGRCSGPQRVDALIPDLALVLEADGRSWHTRTEDFERDRRRDAEAAAAGFQTLRFTWHQLTREPRWVRRILLETAQRRRTEVGGVRSGAQIGSPVPRTSRRRDVGGMGAPNRRPDALNLSEPLS